MQAFEAVLVTLAGVVLAAVLAYLAYRGVRIFRDRAHERGEAMRLLGELVGALRDAKEHTAAVPKLVEGLIAVTKAQVDQLTKVEEAVKLLQRCLFSSDDNRGYLQYSEPDASAEYERQELIDKGIAPAEAAARVKETDIWRQFNLSRR